MDRLSSLMETMRRLEALHARTDFDGEREAAAKALEQVRAKLEELESHEPTVEMSFSTGSVYSAKLLIALLRRYRLKPYRYRGQRRTTIVVRAPRSFIDDLVWPRFVELNAALIAELERLTEKMISEAVYNDTSEAAEVPGLPGPKR